MSDTKQVKLNVCFDITVDVSSDSSDRQKYVDAKFAIIKWLRQELIVPDDTNKLDIQGGFGEFEIYDLKDINVEVL